MKWGVGEKERKGFSSLVKEEEQKREEDSYAPIRIISNRGSELS
jgi:hypothetical protein